jgi:hypothetical protein
MANSAYVVNNGLEIISQRMNSANTEPKYIGWGVGTTAATVTDTALGNASSESRTTGTSSKVTTTITNDTYQVFGEIICVSATKSISEVALFNAATSGTMFMHAVFDAISIVPSDGISFTIKIQLIQV